MYMICCDRNSIAAKVQTSVIILCTKQRIQNKHLNMDLLQLDKQMGMAYAVKNAVRRQKPIRQIK